MARFENYQEALRFAADMEEQGDCMNDFRAIVEDLYAEYGHLPMTEDDEDLTMTAWKIASINTQRRAA